MRLNASVYRVVRSPKAGTVLKIHLGPGQQKYIAGWINVDANIFTAHCDLWADLRHPLPFRDGTVDAIYSHHVIEHLPNLSAHLRDAFRCLRPGGAYRVGGPNGDGAIKKFLDGELSWFGDWPDRRRSIGGRLENFVFCRGEHLTILTFSFLHELMSDIGFTNITRCLPTKETTRPDLFHDCLGVEDESDFDCPHTLIVEADKPAATEARNGVE